MCLRTKEFSPRTISTVQRGVRPGLFVILCLVFVTPTTGWELHTLEVQNTVQRGPDRDLQFFQTTLFNGDIIFFCESPTLTDQPRQDWVKNTFTLKELTNRDKFCQRQYYEHLQWFQEINKIINGTAELLQRRRGCIINGSGIFPFDQWGVNGETFLTFDPQTQTWTPKTESAFPLATEWNQTDLKNQIRNHVYRDFGQTACCTSRGLVKRQKQALGQRAADTDIEVHVFTKSNPGSTTTSLQCHVISSNLSEVKIVLTKDGVPLANGGNLIGPLPNGDGTVQMRLWIPLELKDTDGYQCHVEKVTNQKTVAWDGQTPMRRSTPKEPSKTLDPSQRNTIFGLLMVIVALVSVIVFASTRMDRKKLANLQCVNVEQQVKLYLQFVTSEGAYDKWTKIADTFYGRYERMLRRTRL